MLFIAEKKQRKQTEVIVPEQKAASLMNHHLKEKGRKTGSQEDQEKGPETDQETDRKKDRKKEKVTGLQKDETQNQNLEKRKMEGKEIMKKIERRTNIQIERN